MRWHADAVRGVGSVSGSSEADGAGWGVTARFHSCYIQIKCGGWRGGRCVVGLRGMPLSPTAEDYLQAIDSLANEGQEVIAARLAERLRVSPASVSQTIERMVRQDLVRVGREHQISLTDHGVTATHSIIRRHRLTERFLTDLLGLDWVQAHEEAHRLEHAISDVVEARLSVLLEHPETCPHGSPIPGNFPEGGDRDWVAVKTLAVGDGGTLVRVSEMVEDDPELFRYCADQGLRPGTPFRVRELGPDGLVLLEVAGRSVAVSARLSAHVFGVLEGSPVVSAGVDGL